MTNILFEKLLQDLPPGNYENVQNVLFRTVKGMDSDKIWAVRTPELHIYCENEKCQGVRLFEHNVYPFHFEEIEYNNYPDNCIFIEYVCQNCKEYYKYFALIIEQIEETNEANVIKVGEFPFYGSPIPSNLIKIFGQEKDLFIKGKRCESQNLGIAAFIYYRRVIENQKNRLIDYILKALKLLKTDASTLSIFESAKKEDQFSKSIDLIKNYIPNELFLNNENPLILLHKALSIGIHNLSDNDCLEYAQSIRTILIEFSKKIKAILETHNKLKKSINKLHKIKK